MRRAFTSTFLTLAAATSILAVAPPASACPVCKSETGEQVRAGLADGNLGPGLLALGLPFVVFAGVTLAIHRGPPDDPRP